MAKTDAVSQEIDPASLPSARVGAGPAGGPGGAAQDDAAAVKYATDWDDEVADGPRRSTPAGGTGGVAQDDAAAVKYATDWDDEVAESPRPSTDPAPVPRGQVLDR
jgi:hypothetical protein